jgi:hypothetical protein
VAFTEVAAASSPLTETRLAKTKPAIPLPDNSFARVLYFMEPLLVVGHPGFHQEARDPALHLDHLPHQQMPVAQGPSPVSHFRGRHVTLRKEVTAQAVGDFAGIDSVVLRLRCSDRSKHHRVGDLDRSSVWKHVIVYTQPVKIVASIATVQGCGSVFIQSSSSRRVAPIFPSWWMRPPYKCFATTNVIESPQSGVARRTANVTQWRDREMVERSVASAWLLKEKNFRKIDGHRDLWALAMLSAVNL